MRRVSLFVSFLTLSTILMGSVSHAMFEDELKSEINSFVVRSKSQPEKGQEKQNIVITGVLMTAKPVGHLLRWTGDHVRGNTEVGEMLTQKGLGLVVNTSFGKYVSDDLGKVQENNGLWQSFRKVIGNSFRYVGSKFAGESPLLSRELRKFWVNKKILAPEDVLPSTACALYLAEQIEGVDGIKREYQNFVKAMNSGSWTKPSTDEGKNLEYFLQGLIRAQVKQEKQVSLDNLDNFCNVYGVDYNLLSVTKSITVKTLFPDEEEMKKEKVQDIEQRVKQARDAAFKKFVEGIYQQESAKKQANDNRNQETKTKS